MLISLFYFVKTIHNHCCGPLVGFLFLLVCWHEAYLVFVFALLRESILQQNTMATQTH